MANPRTLKPNTPVSQAPETRVAQVERPEKNEDAEKENIGHSGEYIEVPTQKTTMLGGIPSDRLHRLNVTRALSHLTSMQDALRQLEGHSSIGMRGPYNALHAEMKQMVLENPAYRDAAALLFVGVRPE